MWRTDTWEQVAYLPTRGYPCRPAFVAGKTWIVVGAGDSSLVLWDFGKRRIIRRFQPFDGRPQCIVVAPNRSFIAVGSYRTGYIFRLDGRLLRRLPDCLGQIAVSGDSRRVLYGTCDGDDRPHMEVDLRTGRQVTRPAQGYGAEVLFYRPDGHSFVDVGNFYDNTEDGRKTTAATLVQLARKAKRGPDVTAPKFGFLPALTRWPAFPTIRLAGWQPVPGAPSDAPSTDTADVEVTRWKSRDAGPEDITAVTRKDFTDLYLTPPSGKGVGYRVPGHVYSPTVSPDRRYIAYVTNVRAEYGDTCPVRVIDLQTGRLSPIPLNTTYDSRVSWSPDSRYLALFDLGFDFSKYSTQRVLYCWSLTDNTLRAIATGWNVDVTWPGTGSLAVETGDPRVTRNLFRYSPKTGMLSVASM